MESQKGTEKVAVRLRRETEQTGSLQQRSSCPVAEWHKLLAYLSWGQHVAEYVYVLEFGESESGNALRVEGKETRLLGLPCPTAHVRLRRPQTATTTTPGSAAFFLTFSAS